MAAVLLVMSLESCSKANASADVIEEENNLYAPFLMTCEILVLFGKVTSF